MPLLLLGQHRIRVLLSGRPRTVVSLHATMQPVLADVLSQNLEPNPDVELRLPAPAIPVRAVLKAPIRQLARTDALTPSRATLIAIRQILALGDLAGPNENGGV